MSTGRGGRCPGGSPKAVANSVSSVINEAMHYGGHDAQRTPAVISITHLQIIANYSPLN